MESILNSVKKQIGITNDYTHFDADIIMHINTIFVVLTQLGIGPETGFVIHDDSTLWSEFIPEDHWFFSALKTYMGCRVKLIFDPPISGAHKEALERTINELEYRLYLAVEEDKSSKEVE